MEELRGRKGKTEGGRKKEREKRICYSWELCSFKRSGVVGRRQPPGPHHHTRVSWRICYEHMTRMLT